MKNGTFRNKLLLCVSAPGTSPEPAPQPGKPRSPRRGFFVWSTQKIAPGFAPPGQGPLSQKPSVNSRAAAECGLSRPASARWIEGHYSTSDGSQKGPNSGLPGLSLRASPEERQSKQMLSESRLRTQKRPWPCWDTARAFSIVRIHARARDLARGEGVADRIARRASVTLSLTHFYICIE
jgi:hypothetical protein